MLGDLASLLGHADRPEALRGTNLGGYREFGPATVGQLARLARGLAGETDPVVDADFAAAVGAKLRRAREPIEVAALAQALGAILPPGGNDAHWVTDRVVAAFTATSKPLEMRELVRALAALPRPIDPVVARWVFWKIGTEAGNTRDPFLIGLARTKALALLPGPEASARRPASRCRSHRGRW